MHGGIWDTCFSTLSRLRTGMRAFLHSILQARGSKTGPPRGRVWPMALPYPEVHLKRRRCSSEELQLKLGVNFLVLTSSLVLMSSLLTLSSLLSLSSSSS